MRLIIYLAALAAFGPFTTDIYLPAMHIIEQQFHTSVLRSVLAVSTNFSVMFAFIASSAFIYLQLYHVPVLWFGDLFAINAFALILGSLSLRQLTTRFCTAHIIQLALGIAWSGALGMVIALALAPMQIWSVVVPSFIVTYGVGLAYPTLMGQALNHVLHYNGLATALVGAVRLALAALVGTVMSWFMTDSAQVLAIAMLILSSLTAIFMWGYFRTSFVRLNDL